MLAEATTKLRDNNIQLHTACNELRGELDEHLKELFMLQAEAIRPKAKEVAEEELEAFKKKIKERDAEVLATLLRVRECIGRPGEVEQ